MYSFLFFNTFSVRIRREEVKKLKLFIFFLSYIKIATINKLSIYIYIFSRKRKKCQTVLMGFIWSDFTSNSWDNYRILSATFFFFSLHLSPLIQHVYFHACPWSILSLRISFFRSIKPPIVNSSVYKRNENRQRQIIIIPCGVKSRDSNINELFTIGFVFTSRKKYNFTSQDFFLRMLNSFE
jgi:hypothetical protein